MASQYYNRYSDFLINGEQTVVPFVNLPQKPSDKVFIYKVGKSRLDKTSQEFYNSPVFNWLILQANPQFGGGFFAVGIVSPGLIHCCKKVNLELKPSGVIE